MKKNWVKIFGVMLAIMSFFIAPAYAQIMDPPEKVLQIVNKVNEQLELVEKVYSEYENMIMQLKTGIMGSAMMQMYKDIRQFAESVDKVIQASKKGEMVSVFSAFYDILEQAEIMSEREVAVKMQEEMETVIGQGGDSAAIKDKRDKNEAIQKNNLSSLYAQSLSMRFEAQKNREKIEPELFQENGLELLQSSRAIANRNAARFANILMLESMILEYKATEKIRSQSISNVKESTKLGGQAIVLTNDKEEAKP